MKFYVSKNHDRLNGRPFTPELAVDNVCLNPLYSARISKKSAAKVLLDSGAFQDRKKTQRISPEQALDRQLQYEIRQGFQSELLVSYDRIVDEASGSSGRNKKRVSYYTAAKYVEQTIDGAKYLADSRRDLLPRRLVLSCQGVTTPQYLNCVREVASFAEPSDVIGFGGFCIIGQQRSLSKKFLRVVERALPLLKRRRIQRIHFFGVGYFPALVRANALCRKMGIDPSYDTSSYEFNGVMGRVFDPGVGRREVACYPENVGMATVFPKRDKGTLYDPCQAALLNIRLVQNFWDELNRMPLASELS